jgi:hypothetical protein
VGLKSATPARAAAVTGPAPMIRPDKLFIESQIAEQVNSNSQAPAGKPFFQKRASPPAPAPIFKFNPLY